MKIAYLLAASLALSACSAMNETMDTMEGMSDAATGVAASNMKFEAAFNGGDAAGVAALYNADAVAMPPSAAIVEGRENIQALWQSYIDAGVADLDLNTVSLEDHGGSATERGTVSFTVPNKKGGRDSASGKFIVYWTRGDDGAWRLQWDIWNNNPAG
jgi:uncharacterized protein (TIGR02246 family)